MIKNFYNFAKNTLYPINRSITGEGTKRTLKLIKTKIPKLKIKKISCGKKVFDWKIPDEWNISDAYVLDKNNNRIINFKDNNLHVVGYSRPVNKWINKETFLKKLHSKKKIPNAIPYLTSYYKRDWGFCIEENKKKEFKKKYSNKDKFFVKIDSIFNKNGNLNYGEVVIRGVSKKEILISTYICHPSMANNELSGPLVSMLLIDHFKKKKLNKTMRFIFIPETIGSIAYINKNYKELKKNVIGGFNLTCIGDNRMHSCMLSKNKRSPSDKAVLDAYKKLQIKNYKIHSFLKNGSDERQYNSPGVDLNITSIFRSKYEDFKEYHSSLDDFKLVTIPGIKGGFNVAKKSIDNLQRYIIPKHENICEVFLENKNLDTFLKKSKMVRRDVLNFMQYSDGLNTLNDISKEIKLGYSKCYKLYNFLLHKKILENI